MKRFRLGWASGLVVAGSVALLLAGSLVILGYLPKPHIPMNCGQIVDSYFITIPLGTPPSEILQQRIMAGYDLTEEDLQHGLWWTRDASTYRIEGTETGGILAVRSWRGWIQPNLREVLRCFGNPTAYDAYTYMDHVAGVVVQLWYLDRGEESFMVESRFFLGTDVPLAPAPSAYTEIPTAYDGRLPVTSIYTGDMTYLLSSPGAQLKPWPGRAEDLVIEQMRQVD